MPNKIKVLVVDDSALMRTMLSELIASVPDVEVVGAAADAHSAREMIKSFNPDVLTLDVHMPGMDGLAFLERLMRLRPMPVVMVSAHTSSGSETTLRALELGAVDFIGKPRASTPGALEEYAEELAEKLRAAKRARLKTHQSVVPREPIGKNGRGTGMRLVPGLGEKHMIFVGASTGGTEAIKEYLLGFPENCPPILVVQHMPEAFTGSFARRLDSLVAPRVIESQGGEKIEPGVVYIAPGHSHLRIRKSSAGYVTELLQSDPVNRHRPSVDVLFDSAAELCGSGAIGVILTGMGKDGAQGLLRMRQAGARTLGQDEQSCVVYGMPREAFVIGAVEEQLSLEELSKRTLSLLGRA